MAIACTLLQLINKPIHARATQPWESVRQPTVQSTLPRAGVESEAWMSTAPVSKGKGSSGESRPCADMTASDRSCDRACALTCDCISHALYVSHTLDFCVCAFAFVSSVIHIGATYGRLYMRVVVCFDKNDLRRENSLTSYDMHSITISVRVMTQCYWHSPGGARRSSG